MAEEEILQNETIEQVEAPSEKMLPQSQVDDIVGRRVAEAQARARQQAQQEHEGELQRMREEQNKAQAYGDGGSREADADAIYQQVQEKFNQEMQKKAFEDEISRVAQSYQQKVSAAKGGYSDFDEITANFDPTEFPQLVYLVANMENAGDIIYDISKNPSKLATLNQLAKESPRFAQAELGKLSKSISDNKLAQQEAAGQQVDAPLGRLQPSQISGNNGKMGIRDFKKQPWLRG